MPGSAESAPESGLLRSLPIRSAPVPDIPLARRAHRGVGRKAAWGLLVLVLLGCLTAGVRTWLSLRQSRSTDIAASAAANADPVREFLSLFPDATQHVWIRGDLADWEGSALVSGLYEVNLRVTLRLGLLRNSVVGWYAPKGHVRTVVAARENGIGTKSTASFKDGVWAKFVASGGQLEHLGVSEQCVVYVRVFVEPSSVRGELFDPGDYWRPVPAVRTSPTRYTLGADEHPWQCDRWEFAPGCEVEVREQEFPTVGVVPVAVASAGEAGRP